MQRSATSLRAAIGELQAQVPPDNPATLRVSALDDEKTWLFIDAESRPGLLIREESAISHERVSMRFAEVTVKRNTRCSITTASGSDYLVATVLECDSHDLDVQDFFLCLLIVVLETLTEDPTPDGVEQAIRGLRELLAMTRRRPPQIVGLWTELHTIITSSDPERLARAWHVEAMDPFDFLEGSTAVEVKATQGAVRRHRFRAYQLADPPATLVLSYMLTASDGGPSVFDLLEEAAVLVGSARTKVESLVLGSVHEQIGDAQRVRFARELAEGSRIGYEAKVIPALRPPYPAGVTHVSFDVDLVGLEACRDLGNNLPTLWTAAVPEQLPP